MNIVQRKKTIKLSADVAMASARDGKTLWSRALIAKASKQDDDNNKIIVEKILGDDKFQRVITFIKWIFYKQEGLKKKSK